MRLAAFLIVTFLFTSCETSYDTTIGIYNSLEKNDIIVVSNNLDNHFAVIGPQEMLIADERHGINKSCGMQFHTDYMEGFWIDSIGKIDGGDTVYSQMNYNYAEEWDNHCPDRKSGVQDDYLLIIDAGDF